MDCYSTNSDIVKNHQYFYAGAMKRLVTLVSSMRQLYHRLLCTYKQKLFLPLGRDSNQRRQFLVHFGCPWVVLTLKGKRFHVAFPCPVFSGLGLYPAAIVFHINTRGRVSTLPCLSPRFHLFGSWQIPLSEGGRQLSWQSFARTPPKPVKGSEGQSPPSSPRPPLIVPHARDSPRQCYLVQWVPNPNYRPRAIKIKTLIHASSPVLWGYF